MKKMNTVLGGLLVFASIAFAYPLQAQQAATDKKTDTKKATEPKTDKKPVKKVPAKKTVEKKDKAAK